MNHPLELDSLLLIPLTGALAFLGWVFWNLCRELRRRPRRRN